MVQMTCNSGPVCLNVFFRMFSVSAYKTVLIQFWMCFFAITTRRLPKFEVFMARPLQTVWFGGWVEPNLTAGSTITRSSKLVEQIKWLARCCSRSEPTDAQPPPHTHTHEHEVSISSCFLMTMYQLLVIFKRRIMNNGQYGYWRFFCDVGAYVLGRIW